MPDNVPVAPLRPDFPEIIVREGRFRLFNPWGFGGAAGRAPPVGGSGSSSSSGGGPVGAAGAGAAGLLRPGLTPVLEEIVVTAPRPTAPAPASVFGRFATGTVGFFAVIGGMLAAKITDEISQQALDREFAKAMADDPFIPGDTPLIVAQPEVLPVVTVTATRLQQLRAAPFVLPQLPDFYPDIEMPWELEPLVAPQQVPSEPQVIPDTEIVTPAQPLTIPATRPFMIPRPSTLPSIRPKLRPGQRPLEVPMRQPQRVRLPQPQTATPVQPLTSVQPSVRRSVPTRTRTRKRTRQPSREALPKAQTMTELQRRLCPPAKKCKKEKKERRTECFKKLVKESFDPDFDKEYNWVEIDCLTGRELR